MHRFDRRRYGKQQIVLLLFLLLIGRSVSVWGQLPVGCDYEINMEWKAADIRSCSGYKAGYIGISTGSSSDKAIIIKGSKKFWVHGKNIDNYYRLIVNGDALDATVYLDNATITHGEKVPIWMQGRAGLKLYIMGNSMLKATDAGDPGIQVEPNASLTIYQASGYSGTLTVDGGATASGIGGSSSIPSYGNITINSGNLLLWGDGYYPAIGHYNGAGTINIRGGRVEIATGDFYGIGNDNTTVNISGGTILFNSNGNSYMSGIKGNKVSISGNSVITLNNKSILSNELTISGGKITCTNGTISGSGTIVITGGEVTTSGSSYGISGNLNLSGGKVRASGTSHGLSANYNATVTVTNGELYLSGGSVDLGCGTLNMQGGYVCLEGTSKSLNTGNYNFSGGTLAAVNKFTTVPSCNNFNVQGGSVIVNTPSGTITNGVSNVYRVKIRGYDLTNDQEYNCTVNGKTFRSRLINGYFHFWVPATTRSVTVNGKSIPIDQITTENDPTWYEDNISSLKVNKAPLAAKETNGIMAINRYFDLKTAFSNVAAGNTLTTYFNHTSFWNQTITSTKNITLDLNGVTLDGTNGLSVTGGTLKLKDTSASRGKVVKTVSIGSSGSMRLEGTPLPALSNVTMDGQNVWWGQITGNPETAVQNIQQGNSRTLTLNRHYFIDPDGSMYCWLDNTKNGLTYENTTNPIKYYYTSDPNPANRHGQLLTADTYKAAINNGTVVRYKTLQAAFQASRNQETIRLLESYDPSGITASLLPTAGLVTFDLQGFKLGGNKTLNANGSRLILTSTNGSGQPLVDGKLDGITHLQGLVYSDMTADQLGNGIQRNNKTVYRYPAHKMLVTDRVAYNWGDGRQSDEAVILNGKACLWLPAGTEAAGTVSLGYSADMTKDKCGELLNVPTIGAHADNPELVHPYLNLTSPLTLSCLNNQLSVTHNDMTIADFAVNQKITVYGNVGTKGITIADGTTIQNLTFRNLRSNLGSSNDYAPLQVGQGSTLHLYLEGENTLKGGGQGAGVKAGIEVAGNGCLELHDGTGQLLTVGGAYGATNSPAIRLNTGAVMTVEGATLVARRSDENGLLSAIDAIEGGTLKIHAGSVDVLYKNGRPKNKQDHDVYKVAVTTGLEAGLPYQCTYAEADPTPFMAIPDEAGKLYCWLPAQPLDAPKTEVTLTHPVSYEKTVIEVAKVDENDRNVAPIVIEMTDLASSTVSSYGNLKDAFDAMQSGTPDTPSRYKLALLTRINNLRTAQKIPANTQVQLDLQSFEIAAQNGSAVVFDASASGAYLNITGKGNIKNTFRIMGDVFIDGIVPLTDAVVMLDEQAVFRTLVKDLPVGAGNMYTYSYGQRQNASFYLHEGLACLWLPDYGRSEELRFVVSGSGGSTTDYTAGGITTVTQRTEAIPASPVGVVARVTYSNGSMNYAFNTLKEAFDHARKAFAELKHTDVAVHLLTGVSLSGELKVGGSFCFDLDGKSITSASGARLVVEEGASIIFCDETVGMKATVSADIDLRGTAKLFIPSAIRLSGTVTRNGDNSVLYWRTMVSTRYLPDTVTELTYQGGTYAVQGDEACLWLPADNDNTTDYIFNVNGTDHTVNGYIISADTHANDMTIGGSNNAARVGQTEYVTVEDGFAALNVAGNDADMELLKTSALEQPVSITVSATFELGKYGLTASTGGPKKLTIASGGLLEITSSTGTGELKTPVQFGGGLLFAGYSVTGDHIGEIYAADGTTPLYRLQVTGLPPIIPTGEHVYSFKDTDGNVVSSGKFMVRDGMACLWLPQTNAGTLVFTLGKDYTTENITINPDHFNLETYGVSDVAQIRNGKKYRKLAEALNDAAGKTVIVLKNAVLENAVSISGSVTLEIGDYSITSSTDAQITVPESANLRITGNGSVSVGFTIISSAAGSIYSNGNLQVDRSVNMEATSKVYLNTSPAYRVNVSGLPVTASVVYDCSDQTGRVKSSESGELCLWMQPVNQPVNFSAEAGTDTYLATGIIITPTHVNPLTVTYVEGIAAIGDDIYDTLSEALTLATAGETVVLRKDLTGLGGALEARSDATISLDNNRLITATEGLTLDAGSHLLTLRDGTLEGAVAIDGNVYMKSSVIMNNARVSAAGKTVWRTFLTLPAGTTSFNYTYGDITATCTNIQENVACLWLPSSNTMQALTVTAGDVEYALNNVIIASTHGNELDLTGGNDPVAKVGDKSFASLASALATATEGGTVRLLKDVSLSSVQDIQKSLTLDLGGFSYTSGNSGFSVAAGKVLTIAQGSLLGTIRLNGEGSVKAGSDVKVAGIVLNKDNKECYRTLVKVGSDAAAVMQCHWLESAALTYDLLIPQGSDTYEATVPTDLDNHNTELTAYKRVVLGSGSHTWQAAYANTNLVLAGDAELSLENVMGTTTLHRLTIRDGALVKTSATAGMVIAEEGIRYVRSFIASDRWESVALPFTTTRITTEESGQTVLLTPATGTGTAGNFWLKTMSAEGKLQNVSTTEMTANVSYLMAVPTMWSAQEITFVSGPNQLLRRDKVTAVKPASGFASYANGTFDRLEVKEACYLLNASGDAFELEQPLPSAVTVDPFRGYLLADVNTTTVLPTLRIGTATDVVIPSLPENLRIHTRRGCVVVEAQKEEDVFIYRFDGSLVRALRVGVGQTEIPLAGGFYIVNRTKVIVKY